MDDRSQPNRAIEGWTDVPKLTSDNVPKEIERNIGDNQIDLDSSSQIVTLNARQTLTRKTLISPLAESIYISSTTDLVDIIRTGWIPAEEVWTYASADDPTFTFTIIGDKTSKYYAGQRIKLTQATGGTKYFIITKVEYSAPNTTVTIYGGTDYDLTNQTISSPYYSREKAPTGFPLNPNKWTVTLKDTTLRSKFNPVSNTIYYSDLGSLNISIPIGVWDVTFSGNASSSVAANNYFAAYVALSTSNNSVSDSEMRTRVNEGPNTLNYVQYKNGLFTIRKTLDLASKTTYYVIAYVDWTNHSVLQLLNSVTPLFVKAVCAYL